jgi:hypothetical protein
MLWRDGRCRIITRIAKGVEDGHRGDRLEGVEGYGMTGSREYALSLGIGY